MTKRLRMINELKFQLNSKEVKELHDPVQLSVTHAEQILEMLEAQEERDEVVGSAMDRVIEVMRDLLDKTEPTKEG